MCAFFSTVRETKTVNLQIGATRMEQNKNQFACKLFLVSFSLGKNSWKKWNIKDGMNLFKIFFFLR